MVTQQAWGDWAWRLRLQALSKDGSAWLLGPGELRTPHIAQLEAVHKAAQALPPERAAGQGRAALHTATPTVAMLSHFRRRKGGGRGGATVVAPYWPGLVLVPQAGGDCQRGNDPPEVRGPLHSVQTGRFRVAWGLQNEGGDEKMQYDDSGAEWWLLRDDNETSPIVAEWALKKTAVGTKGDRRALKETATMQTVPAEKARAGDLTVVLHRQKGRNHEAVKRRLLGARPVPRAGGAGVAGAFAALRSKTRCSIYEVCVHQGGLRQEKQPVATGGCRMRNQKKKGGGVRRI
ncbi:hypothetical protein CYMTET_56245 [Cymbomonas tetramitiformis]|uniref:Uncharacterized protein n=1 Tax=Cymbomonas tetramitiformis TaxID=36881 RepID=A0AAE0BBN6_9CHLO|nr:hypothetical protein CYMTET_56245 [Cymbomonas tetramitiformis]